MTAATTTIRYPLPAGLQLDSLQAGRFFVTLALCLALVIEVLLAAKNGAALRGAAAPAAPASEEGAKAVLVEMDPTVRRLEAAKMMLDLGRADEGCAALRSMIASGARNQATLAALGLALIDRGETREAVDVLEEAVDLAPSDPLAHRDLGSALDQAGRMREAASELQRALDLDPAGILLGKDDVASLPVRIKGMLEAEKALDEVIKSGKGPDDDALQLAIPRVAAARGLHLLAARLWNEAFRSQLGSWEESRDDRLWMAVESLVTVALGDARDAAGLSAEQKAQYRQIAIKWLAKDVDLWRQRAQSAGSGAFDRTPYRARARWAVDRWMTDPRLEFIRDADDLLVLPESEREACKALWTMVGVLAKELADPSPQA